MISICKEDRHTMIINAPIPLEAQSLAYRGVVLVPLVVITETCCEMCSDEADMGTRIIHSDGNRALVASDARKARLLHGTFDVLDVVKDRRPHKDAKCRTNELTTPEKHILLTTSRVQAISHSLLPQLFSSRIAVHDLLRAQLDDLLETDNHNLWLC